MQDHITHIKLKISGQTQVASRLTQHKTIAVYPHQQARTLVAFWQLLWYPACILSDLPLGIRNIYSHIWFTLCVPHPGHIDYLII